MYFAYGSNMNLDQMAYRCPAAEAVCTAKLEGYELFFAGRPGNGVASIRPKQGGAVEGVLWKLTQACEKSLDHYEGFPALYGKETVRVRGSDGTEHCVTAVSYTHLDVYKRQLMIPTTAGTGSEATPNAIVAVPEQELKVGIVSDAMIADNVLPVSYTHLDVYKRQGYSRSE